MITNAILNFIFGFFDKVFSLLPIPETPSFVSSAITFITYWIGRGARLVSWLFPANLYHVVINTVLGCLTVRFCYDLYRKFHTLKTPTI